VRGRPGIGSAGFPVHKPRGRVGRAGEELEPSAQVGGYLDGLAPGLVDRVVLRGHLARAVVLGLFNAPCLDMDVAAVACFEPLGAASWPIGSIGGDQPVALTAGLFELGQGAQMLGAGPFPAYQQAHAGPGGQVEKAGQLGDLPVCSQLPAVDLDRGVPDLLRQQVMACPWSPVMVNPVEYSQAKDVCPFPVVIHAVTA